MTLFGGWLKRSDEPGSPGWHRDRRAPSATTIFRHLLIHSILGGRRAWEGWFFDLRGRRRGPIVGHHESRRRGHAEKFLIGGLVRRRPPPDRLESLWAVGPMDGPGRAGRHQPARLSSLGCVRVHGLFCRWPIPKTPLRRGPIGRTGVCPSSGRRHHGVGFL